MLTLPEARADYTGCAPGVKGKGETTRTQDTINPKHDFGPFLSQEDLEDLALFLKYGTLDMRTLIDHKAKRPTRGSLTSGKAIYRVCASCHGEDGRAINFLTPDNPEYVDTLANENPQEVPHKIRNGQPGNFVMPGFSFLLPSQLQNLLAYLQTLPEEQTRPRPRGLDFLEAPFSHAPCTIKPNAPTPPDQ